MTRIFADRMSCIHKSFVREILKVTEDREVISFAGGLVNAGIKLSNYSGIKLSSST